MDQLPAPSGIDLCVFLIFQRLPAPGVCFQAHAESDLRYNGPSSSHATFYLRYRESPLLPPSLSLTVRFSRRRQNEFFKTGQSCPSCVKTRRWLPASPAVKFTVFIAASSALLTWPLRARPLLCSGCSARLGFLAVLWLCQARPHLWNFAPTPPSA